MKTASVVPQTVRALLAIWKTSLEELGSHPREELPAIINILEHPCANLLDQLFDVNDETLMELVGLILEYPMLVTKFLAKRCDITFSKDPVLQDETILFLLSELSRHEYLNEKSRLIFDLLKREKEKGAEALECLELDLHAGQEELIRFAIHHPYAMFMAIQKFTPRNLKTMPPNEVEMFETDMRSFLEKFARAFSEKYQQPLPHVDDFPNTSLGFWWAEWVKKAAVECKYAKDYVSRVREIVSHLHP